MVIFRFATGSNDAAFCGFVNTFLVTRKPFRSKGSGVAMATFLEADRKGEMRIKKPGIGGGPAQVRAGHGKLKEDKTRMACGFEGTLGLLAERI